MSDLISRQEAIGAFWSLDVELRPSAIDAILNRLNGLPSVQLDVPDKNVGDMISRQAAIDACIRVREHRAYDEIEEIEALPSAQPEHLVNDCISRREAIDALWKALYAYEDKTEKQFQESDELDVSDWIEHRIFVQNMSDIDRQTILALPSAQPEQLWIPSGEKPPEEGSYLVWVPFAPPKHRMAVAEYCGGYWNIKTPISAWMPLPAPWKGEQPC